MKRGEDRTEQLRLALIASGDYDPAKLVPGGVTVMAAQDERRGITTQRPADAVVDSSTDPEAVEDYSAVEWESPSTSGEQEVMKDLEMFNAAMAANHNVTVSGGEDEGGEWL